MKKNMKKLASLLFMAMLVLGLTACGSKEPDKTVVDSAYAQQVSDFLVANISGMTAEDMQYYVDMDAEDLQALLDQSGVPVTAEAFQDIFAGYAGDVELFGEYVSTDNYELKGDAEEATHTTSLTFAAHPAILMLVFNEDGVVTTGAGAALAAGASSFFLPAFSIIPVTFGSNAMTKLIKIRITNTVPIPMTVFNPAFSRISPVDNTGSIEPVVTTPSSLNTSIKMAG